MTDMRDVLEYVLASVGVIALGVIAVVAYLAILLLCGWGVECVLNWLNIEIDRTLYWTGVGLLILFCAFGRTTSKKESD